LLFSIGTVLHVPIYYVFGALGIGHGNWTAFVLFYAATAFLFTLLLQWDKRRTVDAIRAAWTAAAVVVVLECMAISTCRITERDKGAAARTCYPHLAGWITGAHLRNRQPGSVTPAAPP
jgi:hypothetical protein